MKKVCLALLVLALTIPTIGAVNITLVKGPEPNSVIVGFTTDVEVRAFALEVTVTDSALLPGTVTRVGAEPNYYLTPTNVGFTSLGSPATTRPWPYNSPLVEADGNSCKIEVATLYSPNDPCASHRTFTGARVLGHDLVKFFVDGTKAGADQRITVTVSQANAKRGKIVLKGPPPTSVDPVNLPISVKLDMGCVKEGQVCGGVMITAAMYNNWVIAGTPSSWCHLGHYAGDADQNCVVNAADLVGGIPGKPFFKAAFGKGCGQPGYAPECDTNDDCIINATDLVGGDPACPNCSPKVNWGAFWPVPPCVIVP